MRLWFTALAIGFSLFWLSEYGQAEKQPTSMNPLVILPEKKEVQVFGTIYPTRFNTAKGDEARYHLLVWQGGTSANALIETPADDLAFHDAVLSLGSQPGDNLTMASWNQRHDPRSAAPREKVAGSALEVHISWVDNPTGIPVDQAFRHVSLQPSDSRLWTLDPGLKWRFGGNRARWFNRVPLAPRPGCLACLYSCPSGKVSNSAMSVHDYMTTPSRFEANTNMLPLDGTPVVVTFRVLEKETKN